MLSARARADPRLFAVSKSLAWLTLVNKVRMEGIDNAHKNL